VCEKQYPKLKGESDKILKYIFTIDKKFLFLIKSPFSLNESRKIDERNREYVEVKAERVNSHKHDLQPI
jgi:hypothetical protein